MRTVGDLAGATALFAEELRRRPAAAGHLMLAEALIVQGRFRVG